jgi:uncharacterized alpha-E superfamily protein
MLSRVADSLYWMSRYLERAEHTVRLLDVNMSLMLDRSGTSVEKRWNRVLTALGHAPEKPWKGDHFELIQSLTFDPSNKASIRAAIVVARENARQVRDEISSEQWQQLNRLYHQVTEPHGYGIEVHVEEFLPAVIDGLHLFQGVTDTTMSHGEGWQFIQMGRSLERAFAIVKLLDMYSSDLLHNNEDEGDGYHYLEWIGLLRCCTAFEAYCRVYTADLSNDRILEFLLLNPEFPHSVRYSIDSLSNALSSIQQTTGRHQADGLTRLAGRLQATLHFIEISEILQDDPAKYLHDILHQCHQIHGQIYRYYIQYSVQAALAT